MREIQVSVVMPCRNDGSTLFEATASIGLEAQPQVELIVVDDGSDDGETLRALEALESRGICVLHTAGEGPSAARNAGIRAAQGRYILPLDADDRIEPAYIAAAKAVLDDDPVCGAVYCHADLFGAASGPWMLPEYSPERMLVENVVFVTAMFRKEDWAAVGGFRTDMRDGLEDYDFFLGLLESGKTIRQLPEVYFHYRIKPKSRTTRLLEDAGATKRAYRSVFEHHQAYYEAHWREAICLLRDEAVQQRYEKERLAEINGLFARLRRLPLAKRLARRLMKRPEG